MKQQIALQLKDKAEEIAKKYSNPNRAKNTFKESYKVNEIIPLSETTAVVIMEKSRGKKIMAFCYYIRFNEGYWGYFIPTDSHILGMEKAKKYLEEIERHNYVFNFEGD